MAEHRSPQEADALLNVLLANIETFESYPERGNVPKELEALSILECRQTLVRPTLDLPGGRPEGRHPGDR